MIYNSVVVMFDVRVVSLWVPTEAFDVIAPVVASLLILLSLTPPISPGISIQVQCGCSTDVCLLQNGTIVTSGRH